MPDNPIVEKPGETIGFTMWWAPAGTLIDIPGKAGWRKPPNDAVRVRVQVERTEDYAAFTFLVDTDDLWIAGGMSWRDSWATFRKDGALSSELRAAIRSRIDTVNSICGPRVGLSDSDDTFPEEVTSTFADPRKCLEDAAGYLYDGLWRLFEKDFKFNMESFNRLGEVFVNVRGLVFSTRAELYSKRIDPDGTVARSEIIPETVAKTIRVSRYQKQLYESAGVLMAYWPFVRSITRQADYREYVGFSVLERRGSM
jgi:hypothetical protein